jgi:hypothetical protein
LLDILVLVVDSKLFMDDIFVLAVLVVVAVVIILIFVVVLVTILVILGHVLLARGFVILVHDSYLVAVIAVVGVQGVLPRARAVVVFLRGDVDLVLVVLMVAISSLPAPAVVMRLLGRNVRLPDQYILLAEHVIQVLWLLPHGRGGHGGALVGVAAPVDLTRSGPLLVLALRVVAMVASSSAMPSVPVAATSTHLLATRIT